MNNGCTIVAFIEKYEYEYIGLQIGGPMSSTTIDQQSTKILLTKSTTALYSDLQKRGFNCLLEVCATREEGSEETCEIIGALFLFLS